MRFADPCNPTTDELRGWSLDHAPEPPVPEWDLILCWGMDRGRLRTCIEIAGQPTERSANFFLLVLYQWASYATKQSNFGAMRLSYCEWLDEARGARGKKVKSWRHRARLFLQSDQPLNEEEWWDSWRSESKET